MLIAMRMSHLQRLVLAGLFTCSAALAQEAAPGKSVSESGGRRRGVPTMTPQPGGPATPGAPVSTPPGGAAPPATPAEPAKTDSSAKVVVRPTKPTTAPNRDEFKLRPDKDGKIKFNFQGQPWADVLAWLATISNLSFDYQETPDGFLNLRTHRSYTVEEARDLINRHLLDRGFTLLKHGEILSVVNIKKGLDPSLVPRVKPEDLDKHLPHEIVKVSFSLETLNAESANDELKPLLSPYGKLSPLRKTNRLEAIDAVANLLEIRAVLGIEQSSRGREQLVKEFKLVNVRAADLRPMLQEFLGLEKTPDASGGASAQSQQQMMMQRQQQMMMQGQHPGQPGQPGGAKPPTPAVRLVINPRENSILADAPADQMAKIVQFVRLYDVPTSRTRGEGLSHALNRTRVYRLASLDPEPLVKMLQEVGDLDPMTKLTVDKKSRAIIVVDAPLVDHMTIATLLKKLDATDRRFEVIKLKRLEADYVAGSIEFMMGGGDKKKNNRSPFYDWYGFGGSRNETEDESKKFRVDADVEHNRLLLWANDAELEEVNRLLVKLGEIPGSGGLGGRTRVLDTMSPEESRELLERLRKVWPSIGNNPLEIDARLVPKEQPSEPATESRPARKPTQPGKTTQTTKPRRIRPVVSPALLEVALADDDEPTLAKPGAPAAVAPADQIPRGADIGDDPLSPAPRRGGRREAAPPIRIGRGPDGQMTITSDDMDALDRLQELLTEMAPPRRDYKIFKMKYRTTWATEVALNLEDYFSEKDKKKRPSWMDYYTTDNSKDERRLSKRKPLKFIVDINSNSILVSGADPHQLKVIQELVDAYDVPESKDSASVRRTKVVRVQYSKAKVIADAVKDVYRDLLSANDPALANSQANQQKQRPEAMYTYVYNSGGDDKKPEAPLKFKGMLSIGVDELSNVLVVSAADGLIETVTSTIQILDEAAKPTVSQLHVIQLNRNLNSEDLQKRLKNVIGKPPAPPQQQPQQPPAQPQQPQQNVNPRSTVVIEN